MEKELTINEKCMLINLAMAITTGSVDYKVIIDECAKSPEDWKEVFYFWNKFNDMTRKAVKLLSLELNYLYL